MPLDWIGLEWLTFKIAIWASDLSFIKKKIQCILFDIRTEFLTISKMALKHFYRCTFMQTMISALAIVKSVPINSEKYLICSKLFGFKHSAKI